MMSVELPIIKNRTSSLRREHQKYLGQTDNVNRTVSRLLIMGNRQEIILRKKTGFV